MTSDFCKECSWQTWRIIFPGPNGLCVWDFCLYCGENRRVFE
jgi:hypothetical protein